MRKKITTIFLLLIVTITLSACGIGGKNQAKSFFGNQQQKQINSSNPELEKEYENELKTIMAPVWQGQQFDGIKDKVLALKAPAKYIELHLNLVLALDKIESGKNNSDQTKVQEGLDKINQLKAQYSWLN
ncbi:MAG: hypothetical protein M1338_00755 [Patescibacteria group bacterium]|nr:hypothetical protein [Patescibacteria group bacterium]